MKVNSLHSKKAQAAMEFLMTYGWALLVVLVAIGALAFFGVLNPGQFLPDQCTMFSGISCTGYYANDFTDTLTLTFQNGLGYAMTLVHVDVAVTAGTGPNTLPKSAAVGAIDCTVLTGGAGQSMADGGTLSCAYGIAAYPASNRLKGIITMDWSDGANLRSRTGNLAVTVEEGV